MSKVIRQSHKLDNVCYDIRGPIMEQAQKMEDDGHRILKLNIGNPARFGFNAPDEILRDVISNLPKAEGYSDSKGIYSARKAIMQQGQVQGLKDIIDVDNIWLGNGVSELIVLALQALLNTGDEVLVPSPDYPLWTASVRLCGGNVVHYLCDEQSDWTPDLDKIEQQITDKTKAIVLINPNNPTGAVYPKEFIIRAAKLAEKYQLVVFADEIYDKILYDDAEHTPLAAHVHETLCISFNGLSKAYRLAGFRSAWMAATGNLQQAKGYLEGLTTLASMRLCANVPGQLAIQTALGGYQSINDLTCPGGRLREQRDLAWDMLSSIPGVSCVKPKAAIYLFPKLDTKRFNLVNDEKLVLDFLTEQKILLVQGTAFNWPRPDHVRIVFLPHRDELKTAISAFSQFLEHYQQN